MTQNYEPIEITENTPEPTEEGTYLLTSPRTGAVLNVFDHDSTLPFGWSSFEDSDNWNGIREDNIGYNIQSLAAHDAQIRADALKLTTDEHDIATQAIDDALTSFNRNDYGIASEDAFSAVAEHRKEQKQ